MQHIHLGKTGIEVPRLFLGTGSWDFKTGCLQEKVAPQKYATILKRAFEAQINFWDTADDYHIHRHVRLAMEGIPREKLIISTKTYGGNATEALRVLDQSLSELSTEYMDLYFFHSVDSLDAFERRMNDALPGLMEAKKNGKIKAIGLSTHTIHVLEKAVDHPELDVILTNFNKYEIHMDASIQWYSRCLKRAHKNGKGVLVMKTIGEGRLRDRAKESIQYNLSQSFIDSVCVGIVTDHDLDQAIEAVGEFEKHTTPNT